MLLLKRSDIVDKNNTCDPCFWKGRKMKRKLKQYIKRIDQLLEQPPEDLDYEELQRQHLVQIRFFMHERLVHEIVMALFALITVMVFLVTVLVPRLVFILLLVALLILLIPYVMHYYVLENGVQYMYEQYDEMEQRKNTASLD